jgi:hypothetical protein
MSNRPAIQAAAYMLVFTACLAACLVLVACASAPRGRTAPEPLAPARIVPRTPTTPARPACMDCGRVERIESVAAIRATSTGGAVLGGVVGGVVSAPAPSARAPIAASGAVRPPQRAWRVKLRMDDGRLLVVHQNLIATGLVVGARVRLVQGRLVPVH